MATIRRLYVYVVCLISLQAVVAAGNALLRGLIRQVAGTDAPDALFYTLQLAILIVGTPILLGHWLWALALARRDPEERNAFIYRLYLLVNQGVFVAYLGYAVYGGARALAEFVLAVVGGQAGAVAHLAGLAENTLTLAGLAALWVYHDLLARDRRLTHSPADRGLYQLYHLGFAGIGLAVLMIGAGGLLALLVNFVFGSGTGRDGPEMLGLVAAGAPLWAFHEVRRARDKHLYDEAAGILRWLYATGFSAVGVVTAASGLASAQRWLYEVVRTSGAADRRPGDSLALLAVGLAVVVYHELAVRRVTTPALQPLRWLYALTVAGIGLFMAVTGLVDALQWALTAFTRASPPLPANATAFVPGALAWLYHQWVAQRLSPALGLAEPSNAGFRSVGRFLRRLYLYSFSGLGVGLTALGLVGFQEQLFSGFRGERLIGLAPSLSWLLVGLPLWLYCWRWAGQLFNSPVPDERASDLRKAYLYAVIYLAVNAVIITAVMLLNGLLRRVVDLPTQGSLGLALGVILAATGLWAYHAAVLRRDLARAGNTSFTPALQRLYWYLVAALGLTAFLAGLAGDLSVVVRALAGQATAGSNLRSDFALYTAMWLAGLPVWLWVWVPAQRAAGQPGTAGADQRRSTLRKLYLYAFALVAVVVALVSAIVVVYQLLNALFGLFEGGNVFSAVAQALGLAVISTAVWLYHAWVLRADNHHLRADRAEQADAEAATKAADAEKLAAAWSDWPVAIIDDGDGAFAQRMLTDLRRDLPYVTLIPVALNPAAAAALNRPLASEVPAGTSLVVAPSTAMGAGGAVAGSPAPKVVVPIAGPGLHWVGVAPMVQPGAQVAQVVAQLLRTLPRPSAPMPPAPTAAPDAPDDSPAPEAGPPPDASPAP